MSDLASLVALPSEDVHCLSNFFFLLLGLSLFSLNLLLGVEHPKLGIDLLLSNGLFKLGSLVHKLLFSF